MTPFCYGQVERESTPWRPADHYRFCPGGCILRCLAPDASLWEVGLPPTQSPVQTVDYIGIAALVSSAGGFFAGVISAVTGLILALKRPGKAPESKGAGESDQPKV